MTALTAEQLAAVLRARADWLDREYVDTPRPYITREQFRAAAAKLEEGAGLVTEVERLRATVIRICDEFEDATYDLNDGGQSRDRKNLIVECRRAALPEEPAQ
jgi:hypothetical protein